MHHHKPRLLSVAFALSLIGLSAFVAGAAPPAQAAAPASHPVPDIVVQLPLLASSDLVITPDDRLLIDESRIWDLQSRRVLRYLPGAHDIQDWALVESGTAAAGLNPDGVGLWRLADGSSAGDCTVANDSPTSFCATGDGSALVVGYRSGKICVWNPSTRSVIKTVAAGTGPIYSLSCSNSGDHAACMSGAPGQAQVLLIDVRAGTTSAVPDSQLTKVQSVALSPNGNQIAVSANDGLVMLSAATGRTLWTFPRSRHSQFTPDGTQIINRRRSSQLFGESISLNDVIDVLDAATGKRLWSRDSGGGSIGEAVSLRGRLVAAGGFGGISLFDRATGVPLGAIGPRELPAIRSIHYLTTSSDLAISTSSDSTFWNPETGRTHKSIHLANSNLLVTPAETVLYHLDDNDIVLSRVDDSSSLPQTYERPKPSASRSYSNNYTSSYTGCLLDSENGRLYGVRNLRKVAASTGLTCNKIDVWDRATGRCLTTFGDSQWTIENRNSHTTSFIVSMAMDDAGKYIAIARLDGPVIELWDTQSGRLARTIPSPFSQYSQVAFQPGSINLAISSDSGALTVWSSGNGRALVSVHQQTGISSLHFSDDGALLFVGDNNGFVDIYVAKTLTFVRQLGQAQDYISGIAVDQDASRCSAISDDGEIRTWSVAGGDLLYTLIPTDGGGFVAVTPAGYYMAEQPDFSTVSFRFGQHSYPFEQFDLQLNRPDMVLRATGSTDKGLIDSYESAYASRLHQIGLTEETLWSSNLPTIAISSESRETTTRGFQFHCEATAAPSSTHVQLIVRDNGAIIPFTFRGSRGGRASAGGQTALSSGSLSGTIGVELNSGANMLQVSVMDNQNLESLRDSLAVVCTTAPEPKLFVLAIGISVYADTTHPLESADFDADAVGTALARTSSNWIDPPDVQTLVNEKASRAAILAERMFLNSAGPDDTVIVFAAGHGVLESGTYYFAPYDMDFSKPSSRGISYADLAGLLEGLRARRRLLLIDSCHAGEVDSTGTYLPAAISEPGRGVTMEEDDQELANAFDLQQDLFTNVTRGSGTTVIAGARGPEVAKETKTHGIFTQCLLDGLAGAAIDPASQSITMSSLLNYVADEVPKRTRNTQHATPREENPEIDFPIAWPAGNRAPESAVQAL